MAYDGWMNLGSELWDSSGEIINLARTTALAEQMGLEAVWTPFRTVEWINQDADPNYDGSDAIEGTPWFAEGQEASREFAGLVPLSLLGLEDSTYESTPVEFITDGGHTGKGRATTLPIVFSVMLVGSSERGVEYGLRWLRKTLKRGSAGNAALCTGESLYYLRYASPNAPRVHRNNVKLTRPVTVTRKRNSGCTWSVTVTFTLTAGDPYEYGEPAEVIDSMGFVSLPEEEDLEPDIEMSPTDGVALTGSGAHAMEELPCAGYDYTPVYDPLFPALVEPPAVPDFYPDGWNMTYGAEVARAYAVFTVPYDVRDMVVVPRITINSDAPVRGARVAIVSSDIVSSDAETDTALCDPLFLAAMTYTGSSYDYGSSVRTTTVLDGEHGWAYIENSDTGVLRRADSLVFSSEGAPVRWTDFDAGDSLILVLDLFGDDYALESRGSDLRISLSLTPKSG